MPALLAAYGLRARQRFSRHPVGVLLAAMALVAASTNAASAGPGQDTDLWNASYDLCMEDLHVNVLDVVTYYIADVECSAYANLIVTPSEPLAAPAAAAPLMGMTATYQSDNFGASLEPGEPTYGGRMHKTIWQSFKLPKNARVVINTFGTGFDTVLAVYTGTSVSKLKLITANDNYAITGTPYTSPGFAARQSLVQFNATANVRYYVQIGSRTGSEGDIFTNVSYQPPGGGLSATLVAQGGFSNAFQGRNYECGFFGFTSNPCTNPTYLVHNSTSQELDVTPGATLGAGIVAPAKFKLGAGKARAVTFAIANSFDKTTIRTISGRFTFTGHVGTTVVANETARALIVIGPNAEGPDVLRASVTSAHVRAAGINEETSYIAVLTNTGATTAVGCHARRIGSEPLLSNWQRIDPSTGKAIGGLGAYFNLAAKTTATLRVYVASQTWRVADTRGHSASVQFDCANTRPASTGLTDGFDFTALSLYRPADVTLTRIAPKVRVVTVKKNGLAVLRLSAINTTPDEKFRVTAVYERPFGEDDPNKQYQLTFCRTATDNGACLAPASANSVEVVGKKGVRLYFKVFVRPPKTDPGYDPRKRAIFLSIRQLSIVEGSFEAVVASEGFVPKLVN